MLKRVLLSLGYRAHPMDNNRMIKPFGYMLFIVTLNDRIISNHFFTQKGVFACWTKRTIEEEKELEKLSLSISTIENDIFKQLSVCPSKPIGFETIQDRMNEIL